MKKILCLFSIVFIFLICKNTNAMQEIGDYGVNIDYVLDYDHYEVIRNAAYRITDNGRMNNPYDTISFNNIYSGQYNLLDLEQQGYKTIVVELSFDAYEINDGYQYVFIYADDTSSTYITGGGLDIPNGYNSGNPDKYVIYFEAQIASFSYKNSFVVRYGASGSFSDDWKVQNLKVQVGFSFEAMKTSNMWRLIKNADGTHTATMI